MKLSLSQIRSLWQRHPVALTGFVLAAIVLVFFVVRIGVSVVYWSDPSHRNMKVEPWMTVGYVGRSWNLDPFEIDDLAGLPKPQGHPLTLLEIARDRGVPVADVVAEVEAAVATLKARQEAERQDGKQGGDKKE